MVSLANLGTAVSRLVAENAIESSETNRLMQRSAHEASEADLDAKNKARETANDMRAASAWVETASSAASVARSGAKVGEAADDYSQYRSTEPQLSEATSQARSTDAATSESGMRELLDTRLGNGRRVGERFSEGQVRALMRDDLAARTGESREQWDARVGGELRNAGFTKEEVNQIWDKAKDGRFSVSDAVEFIWANRKSPEQAKAEQVREKIIDGIQSQTVAFISRGTNEVAKKAQTQAKRSGEQSGRTSEVADKAVEQSSEHEKKLGELEIDALRQRRNGGGSNSSSSQK